MSYRLTRGISRATLSKNGIEWLTAPTVSTSIPVTWTNLSEISIGSELLKNPNFSNSSNSSEQLINGEFNLNSALPNPWSSQDIGSPGSPGNSNYGFGKFNVTGAGDIWNSADTLQYVSMPTTGDIDIAVLVSERSGGDTWAKAGVMIRESLHPGAKNAFMAITPNEGTSFQYRTHTDNSTSHSGWSSGPEAPYWVRLVRSVNTFSGYISADGSSWSLVQTQAIAMSANIYAGLAVSSGASNTCGVVFENMTVGGQVLQRGWSVSTGDLLQQQLDLGVIQGNGASVSIVQNLDLSIGRYTVSPTRVDNTGSVKIKFDQPVNWDDGSANEKLIDPGDSEEFEIQMGNAIPTNITLETMDASRKVTSLSVVSEKAFLDWVVVDGIINQTELENGIVASIDGNDPLSIEATLASPLDPAVEYTLDHIRTDTLIEKITVNTKENNGDLIAVTWTGGQNNASSENSNQIERGERIQFATPAGTNYVSKIKITLVPGNLGSPIKLNAISLSIKEVSGGSVQAFSGGSIEKISGIPGYNSGASSVEFIDGNSDGYVQFQLGQNNKPIKIGLVYLDENFITTLPYGLNFGGNGMIDLTNPAQNDFIAYDSGDWFRIRHYSDANEIKFQKKQSLGYNLMGNWYNDASGFYFDITTSSFSNMNYHVDEDGGSTSYFIKVLEDGTFELYSDDASSLMASGTYDPASKKITWSTNDIWEFQDNPGPENLGEDFITFHTSSVATTGQDLFVDTSFYAVGGRLNDVQIVR